MMLTCKILPALRDLLKTAKSATSKSAKSASKFYTIFELGKKITMRKFGSLIFLLSGFQFAIAQNQPNLEEVFQQINKEVMTNSKAYSTLKDATSSIGHRLTGSENGKRAEEYAYNLFKSYGFTDVRYQPFEVESWSRENVSVKIGAINQLQPIKSVALAHSPVKANFNGELVDMGNGLEEDYQQAADKVKGKAALVYIGILPGTKEGTRNLHRSEKTALAIKYGAKAIVVINAVDSGVLLTGTASVNGKLISIPAVCIGKEDGLQFKKTLQTGKLFVDLSMTNFSGKIRARNVIATLRGKKFPNEKIVVGGHLDSWDLATGAIDNGIGSFSILDMARTFNSLSLQTDRTVEFVMFMGEEEGLLGSKAYVQEAKKDGSLKNVRFMLNYDMVNDPKGYSTSAPEMKELFQKVGAIAQSIDSSFTNLFSARAGLHSDHQPFMLEGIPVGSGTGGRLPNNAGRCYHADCDDFHLVEESGMKNTVRYNSMLIYALATDEIAARPLSDQETKEFLIKNDLKEPLTIAGEWRWKN